MNYRMIGYVLGWILMFQGFFLAVPTVTGFIFGESAAFVYLITMLCCITAGFFIRLKKPGNTALFSRDGFVIASLSWILLSLIGAIPMCLTGDIPSYIDAFFEAVSGFTTTGASVITNLDGITKATIMWRSFTHWVGGMGVLVFIMAFVSISGGQNMYIMRAESPGPSVSKLVPRVKKTAMILYAIYFVMTLIEFILLLIFGMSVFEALNTAFATAGTGGFGFYNDSMASFSPALQIIVTVFMLLFSINFNSYYFIVMRKWKESLTTEVKTFLGIVFVAITAITINISSMYSSLGDAIRHSAFSVATVISTTGFGTEDFNLWPEFSRTILVILMFVGACAGSTGGGIKVSRFLILAKTMGKELGSLLHPKQVKKIKLDGHEIEHETVRSLNVYMAFYCLIFTVAMVLISFDGHDLITNFTAITATFNNIGPGLELVGPKGSYAFFSEPVKLMLSFIMLAGRLELFPMLILFKPETWKKR